MRVTFKFERVPRAVRRRRHRAKQLRKSAAKLRRAIGPYDDRTYYEHIDTSVGDLVIGLARDLDDQADELEMEC